MQTEYVRISVRQRKVPNYAIVGMGIIALLLLSVLCAWFHGAEVQQALSLGTLSPPSLWVRSSGERVVVRGILPDRKTRNGVMAAAAKSYGEVLDSTVVSDTVGEARWMSVTPGLFGALKQGVKTPGFAIEKGTVTVRGIVKNDDVRKKLLADVSAVTPSLTVIDGTAIEADAVQRDINQFLDGKTIEFTAGSADLLPKGKAILDTIAILLTNAPDASVEVGGHTDNQGSEKTNMSLSQRRADATKDYLVRKGIDSRRLNAVGYGQSQPIATNFTPDGRRRNRRIEFILKEK